MEFVIQKADLVRELQTVTGVVEKRATLPILANLLLEAEGDALRVGASDLEITIRGHVPAKVKQAGSVTLPAAKLFEIARSLPDAEVQFRLMDRNVVAISCQRTRYKIAGQPRDEFPSFPEIDESKAVRLPGRLLNQMIERVAFAITMDDPRYSLNGALILLEKNRLTLVATDSHRLSYIASELDLEVPGDEQRLIVPRKALHEVSKLTSDLEEDEAISFGRSDNQVFFIVRDHRMTANVLEGNFPRYNNVMPDTCKTQVAVSREELTDAVRRVSLLASDRYGRAVKLGLSKGKLDLFSKTEVGEATESLAIDYEGDDINIGFNARYILDFLNVAGSDSVFLELDPVKPGGDDRGDASEKPGQLRPSPDSSFDYRYVVMPMHL